MDGDCVLKCSTGVHGVQLPAKCKVSCMNNTFQCITLHYTTPIFLLPLHYYLTHPCTFMHECTNHLITIIILPNHHNNPTKFLLMGKFKGIVLLLLLLLVVLCCTMQLASSSAVFAAAEVDEREIIPITEDEEAADWHRQQKTAAEEEEEEKERGQSRDRSRDWRIIKDKEEAEKERGQSRDWRITKDKEEVEKERGQSRDWTITKDKEEAEKERDQSRDWRITKDKEEEKERGRQSRDWRRIIKDEEEAEKEEEEAKAADWHRREKTAEEEEERGQSRDWRKRKEEEEEPVRPVGPPGREAMFLLRDSKRVVSTEAGEVRVVRGFGKGGWFGIGFGGVERELHVGFISMEPRSLFLPQYLDSSLIIFVRRGEAKIGLIYEDEIGERRLKMGDVYRIPAGSTFYILNTGEAQRLQIICSIDASEGLGFGRDPFQSFFIGGGIDPVSVLAGFEPETLSTAFNVTMKELQEVMTRQKAGKIVFADTTNTTDAPILWANFLELKEEDRLEQLKKVAPNEQVDKKEEEDETKWSWRNILDPLLGPENKKTGKKDDKKKRAGSTPDSYNLFDRDPSFRNDYGWSIALDKHDYHPLKKSGIGIYYVNLTAGSMMAPHINPMATEYGTVLRGSGTIQVVFPNGTSGMNTEVHEGDVFWIPRYFPFCQIASRTGPFEFFGFTTSAHRNRPQFLIGAASILRGMAGPEMATAFGLSEDRYIDLVEAQRESIILPSPGAAPPRVDPETQAEAGMRAEKGKKKGEVVIENVPKFVRGVGREMLMDLD